MPPDRTVSAAVRVVPQRSNLVTDSGAAGSRQASAASAARSAESQPGFLGAERAALPRAHAWRTALPAVVLCVLWITAWYWSTGAGMVQIWARSDTFAHGFVVLPIALWLVWRSRGELSRLSPRPGWWALAPMAIAGFVWFLGELTATNAVSQFSLIALLVLTVPAVLGTRVTQAIAFPLGFLFFAVPIGEFIMPRLMEWTADFTVLALRISGIPVYREGLQFVIPSGTWSVVEACSGIRYLIASLMIGTLYAYLNYRSLSRRLIFAGFAILVPIIANWLRAYMIVMIGHLSGNTLAVGVDHLIYGWLFFGVVITIMFAVGARWREDQVDPIVLSATANAEPPASAPGAHFWLAGAAVAAVATLWHVGYWMLERSDSAPPPQLAALTSNDWDSTPGGITSWRPRFYHPSTESHRTFNKGSSTVGLYIGYYRNQGHGRKLVNSENVLVPTLDPIWTKVAGGRRDISFSQQPLTIDTAELRGVNGERLVVWHWYWINGHATTSAHWAKVYTALSRLQGRGDDSAAIIAYTRRDVPGGPDAALAAFARDNSASIEASLRQTSDKR